MNYEPLLNCNARAELARRNFKDFVLYMNQNYSMQWFHTLICEKLNQFERGNIKKLMIFLPPQHGKSELSTRLYPAYLLGKNPNRKIVVASYNATLASRFNRDIQRNIDNESYHSVFPNSVLNQSNVVTVSSSWLRNSEIFEIVGYNGFLKTVGRGGALTGTPIDIGIIDDPIKDRAEAMSSTIREGLWSWYQDVFETRLHNNSQHILIQTRWHEDDLAGKLLKRDNDWEIILLEAIKETNHEYDPRQIGEALWEEKHSKERIEKIKLTSPITFNSLYQQSPKPLDSIGIFWDKNIINRLRIKELPILTRIVVAIDPATTNNESSDETGIVVTGSNASGHKFILQDLSGKYTPNQWAKVALDALKSWNADCIVAEKNQGGDMVEAIIRQLDQVVRIKLVQATKGKAVRAEPVYSEYEQGKVWHVGEFPILEYQMITFNPDFNPESPDRLDAMVWAITELTMFKKRQTW